VSERSIAMLADQPPMVVRAELLNRFVLVPCIFAFLTPDATAALYALRMLQGFAGLNSTRGLWSSDECAPYQLLPFLLLLLLTSYS